MVQGTRDGCAQINCISVSMEIIKKFSLSLII
jgi:hypothetical protein